MTTLPIPRHRHRWQTVYALGVAVDQCAVCGNARAPGSELEEALAGQIRMYRSSLRRDGPWDGMVREHRFAAPDRKWRFDFAWPSRKVAVEVEGGIYANGGHNRGAHIESDAEKISTAAALGWRVLRVTGKMIEDGRALALIERALA